MSGCFSLGVFCMGLWSSWIWVAISLFMLGKFSTIPWNIFSYFFIFLLFFCDHCNSNYILMLSQKSLKLSSYVFIHLFIILLCFSFLLPFYLPAHLSILLSQLFWYWSPLVNFYLRYCFSIADCPHLIISMFLLNIYFFILDSCLHSISLALFISKI